MASESLKDHWVVGQVLEDVETVGLRNDRVLLTSDQDSSIVDVMREVRRVLRPGGSVLLSQSNRCFFTKAVGVWTRDMSDAAHLRVLGTYIHFAGGLSPPAATDISASGTGTNDPMYLVSAKRE